MSKYENMINKMKFDNITDNTNYTEKKQSPKHKLNKTFDEEFVKKGYKVYKKQEPVLEGGKTSMKIVEDRPLKTEVLADELIETTGAGKSKPVKKENRWLKLIKEVMSKQKINKVSDAIKYIKENSLYKK